MWANASSFVQNLGILARELLTGSLVGIPSSVISAIAYKVDKPRKSRAWQLHEHWGADSTKYANALREIVPQCPAYLLLFP
jgi:hypothetical protein